MPKTAMPKTFAHTFNLDRQEAIYGPGSGAFLLTKPMKTSRSLPTLRDDRVPFSGYNGGNQPLRKSPNNLPGFEYGRFQVKYDPRFDAVMFEKRQRERQKLRTAERLRRRMLEDPWVRKIHTAEESERERQETYGTVRKKGSPKNTDDAAPPQIDMVWDAEATRRRRARAIVEQEMDELEEQLPRVKERPPSSPPHIAVEAGQRRQAHKPWFGQQRVVGGMLSVFVRCAALPLMDEYSLSDPQCVVFEKDEREGAGGPTSSPTWRQSLATQAVKGTQDPVFRRVLLLPFDARRPRTMLLRVYDTAYSRMKMSQKLGCLMGQVEIDVNALVQTAVERREEWQSSRAEHEEDEDHPLSLAKAKDTGVEVSEDGVVTMRFTLSPGTSLSLNRRYKNRPGDPDPAIYLQCEVLRKGVRKKKRVVRKVKRDELERVQAAVLPKRIPNHTVFHT